MKHNAVSNESRDILSQSNVITFEICGACMKPPVFLALNISARSDEGTCCEFSMAFHVRQDVVSYGLLEIAVHAFCSQEADVIQVFVI